jgi:hypothetical protein
VSRSIALGAVRPAAAVAAILLAATTFPVSSATLPSVRGIAEAVARSVVLEGVLQVEVADYPDRSSITRHFLKTASGQRHELRFKEGHRLAGLQSGARVRVRGLLSDRILTAEASPTPLDPAPADVAAAMPYAVGTQKTAVILVNFQDKATSPQTPAAVHSLVFGQVNNFLLENSFQTTSLSGNVFGWYTIPQSSTNCDIGAIRNQARSAAAAAGADLSPYSRFIYMFPNTAACGWAGYGIIGGSPTDAWINGYFDRRIIAHELGHNLGLRHAHSQECGASSIAGSCTASEYGDLVDTMGWGLYGHFSAYQKETLGWLNYGGMPPIATVESSGSYSLAPYAGGSGGNRALKILKGTNPSTGEKTWYYVEFRQPTGYDGVLAGTGNLTSGVTVRSGSASGGAFLLDMTPGSDYSSEYNDLKDAALAVGRTFTDSAAGVALRVVRADNTGATVDVSLGGSTACTRAKPAVVISPSQASTVAAGTQVHYTVAVTNNDSAACGSSAFNLGRSMPVGWSGVLRTASLTVGAGTAASTALTVTSPTGAVPGSYNFGISAANGTSSLSGSASATYSIGGAAGNLSESLYLAKSLYSRSSTATPVVTVKKDGALLANASVTFRLTKANGQVVSYPTSTNGSGQAYYAYWIPATDPVGAYRFDVTASSGGLSAATSVNFTVQ